MTGTPLVVLDACVLANFSLCDTLLRLAEPPRLFEPKWSEEIIRETTRTLELNLGSSSTVCDAKWRQLVDSTQGDAFRREILVSRHFSQIAANRYCYLQLSARS